MAGSTPPPSLSASWTSGPGMNDPGFLKFMQGIAQDYANYAPAMGYTNTPVSSLFQELGEGAQGQTLLKMYQGGVTGDQVHQAYYGQYGGIDPSQVAALGDTDPSKLSGPMLDAYNKGLLQYVPAVAGDPGQTADAPGHYVLQAPVTHTGDPGAKGNDPTIAQPLFSHTTQTGLDTGAFTFDPNKGFVTSPGNVHGSSSNTFLDEVVPIAATTGLGAIGGAALGPLLGSFASPVFNSIMGMLQGNGINPGSFLDAGLSSLGIPPQLAQLITSVAQSGGKGGILNMIGGPGGAIGDLSKLFSVLSGQLQTSSG